MNLYTEIQGNRSIVSLKILFLSFFLLITQLGNAQNQKVTITGTNITLRSAFDQIEKQTQMSVDYEQFSLDHNKKVSSPLPSGKLADVLTQLLKESNCEFAIKDSHILITPKPKADKARKVSGTVLDAKGEAVIGATVMVKGTKNGTVTDVNGNYSLDATNQSTLVISYVGCLPTEVNVGQKSNFVIKLKEDTKNLEEVVVIGYGTSSKKKMVSSVSSINTEQITKAPYTSVINGLAGRTPGLIVAESGGEYGSSPTISIRGGGEPIYVIDGIIATKSEFSFIPANDIEKISFLKDAAACAVYGFNSANGVILVTTKKGSSGKISFTYSGNLAFQSPTLMPEYMTAYELAELKNSAAFNDGLPQVVNPEMLNILKNNLDPVKYPNFNPFDEVVKKSAAMKSHNISMNGTINNTNIFMSLDYFGQDGIYKSNDHGLNRYSFRSNISHKFENIGLRIDGNVSLQRQVKTAPPRSTWEIWSHVRNWASGNPLYNPDGNYYGLENPVAEADSKAGNRTEERNKVNTRLAFVWDVPQVKGLTLKAIGNYRLNNDFDKYWNANQRFSAPTYSWTNVLNEMGKPSLSESMGRSYQYDLEGHVNYLRTFADAHTIELTGVYTQGESKYDGFNASRKDFTSPAVDQLFAGSEVGKDNSGNAAESGRIGYVGRLKYDFKTRYVLEANFRYDGYDGFAKEKQFKFFPSMSLGWNIDRESFVVDPMSKIGMSALKLRASWGKLGKLGENDGEISANRFGYLSVYNLVNNAYYIDGSWRTGFAEGGLTPSLETSSWYDVESKNIGIDFGFLKDKLTGSIDWFMYRTTGYLASPSATYTTPLGKDLPKINTNSAHRRGGVEFSLNYKTAIGKLNLNLGGNITYFDQLWEKKFDEDNTSLMNPYKRLTQQRDYYTVGYVNLGYYQNMNDVLANPRRLGSTETMPGDLMYQDFNGDGRIDGDDQIRIGKSEFAHMMYGFTLDADYKGFSLSALFQGAGNRQKYLGGMWRNELNHKLYTIQKDSWTAENPNALFPRTSTGNDVNGSNNNVSTDFWLVDAWYIRMKSLSLSYDLKTSILKKVNNIGQFQLLLSATNLFTISPLNKYYMDPETGSNDNYGYPVGRAINVGLRVAF